MSESDQSSLGSGLRQKSGRGLDFGADRAYDRKKAARAVRFRIMTLMILLLAVIFAMKEAGKPERWMWMGFDKIDQSPKPGDVLVDTSNGSIKGGTSSSADWSISKSASGSSAGMAKAGIGTEGAIGLSVNDSGPLSSDQHDIEFWRATYKRLPDEKQLQLFGVLRKVVQSDFAAPEDPAPLKKIVERLSKEQSDFQTSALGAISLLSDAAEKKRKTESLFEFDQRWQQEILPTLNASVAGDDYSFAGQMEIKKVVQVLRPLFLDAVEDLTGMGTRGDVTGWVTVWDEAVGEEQPVVTSARWADEVSFLQLSGQPKIYRGKQVSVSGQARTCRKKLLKQTQLPVDHYYEVWVEPLDTDGDGLFCIFAAKIPDSFPKEIVDKQSGKFHAVDFPVSLTGRFFKVRSYRDAGGGVSHSPVVITRQIEPNLAATGTSLARSIPSATYSAFWFSGIAVFATGLAVIIFRSSRTVARQPGKSSVKRMQRSLEKLEQDTSIKSPAQRVAELHENQEADSGDGTDE